MEFELWWMLWDWRLICCNWTFLSPVWKSFCMIVHGFLFKSSLSSFGWSLYPFNNIHFTINAIANFKILKCHSIPCWLGSFYQALFTITHHQCEMINFPGHFTFTTCCSCTVFPYETSLDNLKSLLFETLKLHCSLLCLLWNVTYLIIPLAGHVFHI